MKRLGLVVFFIIFCIHLYGCGAGGDSPVDTVAPQNPSITINNGAASTGYTSVTLTLSAIDDVEVSEYYVSEDPTTSVSDAGGWVSVNPTTRYNAEIPFNLSNGGGSKNVYAWFKDVSGNISNSASDEITLGPTELWNVTYDSDNKDFGFGIAIDSSGDPYVAGWSATNDRNYFDIRTIKYNSSDGTMLWNATYNSDISVGCNRFEEGEGNCNDFASGIALDATGNIYVAGRSFNGTNYDFRIIKYDSNGGQIWGVVYDSGYNDFGSDVALDTDGNAYVTGWSKAAGGDSATFDFRTIKYDSNGTEVWSAVYDSGNNDFALGIALDATGNIYVGGGSYNGIGYDFRIIKYDSNGTKVGNITYDSGVDDFAYDVAVDGDGNVYVTGGTKDGTNSNSFHTIKYDSNGEQVWNVTTIVITYGFAYGVALDADGSIYVAGRSFNGTNYDFRIIKYDSDGGEIWSAVYDSGNNDFASGIALDATGNIYVEGGSYNGIGYDFRTIKYAQ